MKFNQKKALKIALIILAAGILIIGACGVWFANGNLTQAKIKVLNVIPYPIALVNGQGVSMKDFILRLDTAQKVAGMPNESAQSPAIKKEIYEQLVEEEKTRQVAASKKVSVSGKQVEEEYKNQANAEGNADFASQLKAYGLSAADFKNRILRPQLVLVNLKIWFNSQQSLNQAAYNTAGSLVQREQQGESMASLASAQTEDEMGRATAGDLGFLEPPDLLAELREPVANMKEGEVKVLPSRFGLHIIKLEGLNGNKMHLRQIFLKTGDFDQWLTGQKKNFKVWNLVSI